MHHGQRIIAVGSWHGDDQVGWRLIERLRSGRGMNASLITLSDPFRLLDHIENCHRLVVVDACAGGGQPGTVTRLEWPDERIAVRHAHSTHGLSVADALRLAEQTHGLPAEVVLFGIELAQCGPGQELSDVVAHALDQLEEQIMVELEQSSQAVQRPGRSCCENRLDRD
ncbi:MAG: hydrogenase maturation protease [Planctomycetales bacterium]|nr:hydrogenase maturation protease [Planctomycetales bacterium]NIM08875.1 hydrogenase maturation protease [Planctomycetales bacterium]NIN08335.1 hydrogenase maturation protease [Planctomycetales bacterium]NIN77463.1 hydrogenase maturation protease [Planctomycetales bacterium]NIO34635.1 hydrogenase maturation protease [Planctomycetales bacterium]